MLATIAVRADKDAFGGKLEAYGDPEKDNAAGIPSNHKLIAPIVAITPASLDSRWTDTIDLPGDDPAPQRWELWVIAEGEPASVAAEQFRGIAKRAGIALSLTHLTFLDRVVFHAIAPRHALAASAEMLDRVAEIRLAKPPPEVIQGLPLADRRRIAEGIVGRVVAPATDAPYVCLLDTGVNRAHPLIEPHLARSDMHTVNPAWGIQDNEHHGTGMAGLALYGDLAGAGASTGPINLTHRLESSKIFRRDVPESGELHGSIMTQGISRPEIVDPFRRRVHCLAVTTPEGRDRGMPSAWSAEVDQRCWESDAVDVRRLMFVSAGNSHPRAATDYPAGNVTDAIHDPGQAWNAVTVGACTNKVQLTEPTHLGWRPLAPDGGLGPSSTTSMIWESSWPLKPEIVMEGGNLAASPVGALESPDSLRPLTTHFQSIAEPFQVFGDTSAAAALASRMAAQLTARYPVLWPEAVRALMVHSARWTPAMERQFPANDSRSRVLRVRACGYGVPDLTRAAVSAADALTLVVQESLVPFDRDKTQDMHLHALPWPAAALQALGETPVTLRVTLSYFVAPNPARRGYTGKHPYPSHHLGFDVINPAELVVDFRKRVNGRENFDRRGAREARGWMLGAETRRAGSIHCDWWNGTAADLARRSHLAVYPTKGWWRSHPAPTGAPREARYALIVSIETPPGVTDLYTPVAAMTELVRSLAVEAVVTVE